MNKPITKTYQNKTRETTRVNYYEANEVVDYVKKNNKSMTLFLRKASKMLMDKELKAK